MVHDTETPRGTVQVLRLETTDPYAPSIELRFQSGPGMFSLHLNCSQAETLALSLFHEIARQTDEGEG